MASSRREGLPSA
ncbi:hypothetical protein AZE42_05984 [Rhizopogon vesiculosus]|uniref:Uncharacterized protein n=1 Tax=Rhizopogon vesiculosus TaxID=180088 RepID=A0A1J8RBW3_9AGAM|nr:hypothetical protein AZE42_05984 [Rhizopogon vesiculosus]